MHTYYKPGENCWIDEVTEVDQNILIHMASFGKKATQQMIRLID